MVGLARRCVTNTTSRRPIMDSDGASEETTFERVKELPKRGGAATLARPRTRSRSLPLRTGPRQKLHRAFRNEVLKRFMKDDLEVATDATLVGFAGPKSQQVSSRPPSVVSKFCFSRSFASRFSAETTQ